MSGSSRDYFGKPLEPPGVELVVSSPFEGQKFVLSRELPSWNSGSGSYGDASFRSTDVVAFEGPTRVVNEFEFPAGLWAHSFPASGSGVNTAAFNVDFGDFVLLGPIGYPAFESEYPAEFGIRRVDKASGAASYTLLMESEVEAFGFLGAVCSVELGGALFPVLDWVKGKYTALFFDAFTGSVTMQEDFAPPPDFNSGVYLAGALYLGGNRFGMVEEASWATPPSYDLVVFEVVDGVVSEVGRISTPWNLGHLLSVGGYRSSESMYEVDVERGLLFINAYGSDVGTICLDINNFEVKWTVPDWPVVGNPVPGKWHRELGEYWIADVNTVNGDARVRRYAPFWDEESEELVLNEQPPFELSGVLYTGQLVDHVFGSFVWLGGNDGSITVYDVSSDVEVVATTGRPADFYPRCFLSDDSGAAVYYFVGFELTRVASDGGVEKRTLPVFFDDNTTMPGVIDGQLWVGGWPVNTGGVPASYFVWALDFPPPQREVGSVTMGLLFEVLET